jgi:hypothetical protein
MHNGLIMDTWLLSFLLIGLSCQNRRSKVYAINFSKYHLNEHTDGVFFDKESGKKNLVLNKKAEILSSYDMKARLSFFSDCPAPFVFF